MNIHPTAIIEKGAQLAETVTIGALAYIGPNVKINDETLIQHHATVEGNTTLGKNNVIYPYASIGGQTQDLKYRNGFCGLIIGDNNIFREYTTVHCGTQEGSLTQIGNNNAFLAYAHIAHDCVIGNHVIMSSLAALAGHVHVGNYANIAWNSGVHQFCKIGDYAMLAASSKALMDILPFMIAEGLPAKTRAFNKINLERNGFSADQIEHIKNIFRILFHTKGNRSEALEKLREFSGETHGFYATTIHAIESSQRGFC